MNQMQLFPFERNRYYYGKMLTSGDFQAEQRYMNTKRMFLNQMIFGSGVICGMSVYNLDDFSVLIESGVAIDPQGREIVMESSVVKKLAALDGYATQGSERLSLCVKYKESETQPVYAVNRKEDQSEYENNRITEGYELFLVERESIENIFQLDSEFFVEEVLLDSEDYVVKIRIPATACKGRKMKLSVEVEKRSSSEVPLDFHYCLQFPVFLTPEGTQELEIERTGIVLREKERYCFSYWVYTKSTDLNETTILMKSDGGEQKELRVILTDKEPERLVSEELGKTSLEIRNSNEELEYIRLADIDMMRTESSYIIEHIEDRSAKNYITVPAYADRREGYLSYYDSGEWSYSAEDTQTEETGECVSEELWKQPMVANGTIEIPLDVNMKKGKICFSEEIIHGLGPGNVYVAVGIDQLDDGVHCKKKTKSTIYGETVLFEEQNPLETRIKTAVKVWSDKGSFQVAVQLQGEQKTVLVSLHWTALRVPEVTEDVLISNMEMMRIEPENGTVKLTSGEKHYFGVTFHNMEPCKVIYELPDEERGEIDEDGTYTAPNRQGVYRIRMFCQDYPAIAANAFAVVSGETEDEKDEENQ